MHISVIIIVHTKKNTTEKLHAKIFTFILILNKVQKTLGYLFRAVAHLMHKTVTYEVQKIPIFTLYLILAKREKILKFYFIYLLPTKKEVVLVKEMERDVEW